MFRATSFSRSQPMARTAWESVVGWSPGPVKELAPVPGKALYSSEGLSEMVVPEALGLDSLSGAGLHKISGRDDWIFYKLSRKVIY